MAKKVQVTSKFYNDTLSYTWESNGNNDFTITQDASEAFSRGTEVTLYLKDDSLEFLEEGKLVMLLEKYAEFIVNPIWLVNT